MNIVFCLIFISIQLMMNKKLTKKQEVHSFVKTSTDWSLESKHAQKVNFFPAIQGRYMCNSEVIYAMWPSLNLVWDFMPFLVICKFHKGLIETV